ncbi:MAG TPA: hypothetical protein VMS00_13640 [Acidimicrobiales bacterium]|nr:hypothetical protein [Acidimicrobiales bacterium]
MATSLAPTSSQAAYAIVGAWSEGNRKLALADATPSAVSALFAHAYPPGGPQYRGCSSPPGNQPSICVWRSGNALLSLTVSPFPKGWAVTGAQLEN